MVKLIFFALEILVFTSEVSAPGIMQEARQCLGGGQPWQLLGHQGGPSAVLS